MLHGKTAWRRLGVRRRVIGEDGSAYAITPTSVALFRQPWQVELEVATRPERDPDKPPPKKPGDESIVAGLITGVLMGGGLGLLVGVTTRLSNTFGLVAGAVIGGFIGVFVGDRIKWALARRRQRKWERQRRTPPKMQLPE